MLITDPSNPQKTPVKWAQPSSLFHRRANGLSCLRSHSRQRERLLGSQVPTGSPAGAATQTVSLEISRGGKIVKEDVDGAEEQSAVRRAHDPLPEEPREVALTLSLGHMEVRARQVWVDGASDETLSAVLD